MQKKMSDVEGKDDDESNKPVYTIRAGSVQAAVFKHKRVAKGEDREFDSFSISITKSFKNAQGIWVRTSNFNVNELPMVQLAAGKAFEFLKIKEGE